jgi:hypothetical protein
VQAKWGFDITVRPPAKGHFGTRILITELHDEVMRRLNDGFFLSELKERISRTYSFFIGRIVTIRLNDDEINKEQFEIGSNFASEKFQRGDVSCNITAGIAAVRGESFRERNAGWFVFCNGRAVLFADKSALTGWTGGGQLPTFQPKHRPFLGVVFFVSPDPEDLPWTTTKSGINEESLIWQEAKRYMVTVGRVITGFLDSRYSDDNQTVAPPDLQRASGQAVSVLSAAVSSSQQFKLPRSAAPKMIRIQYQAKVADIRAIESYLRRPGMGGSEVGRYTFNWFLKNEVGQDE